jgi:hypothetical protein
MIRALVFRIPHVREDIGMLRVAAYVVIAFGLLCALLGCKGEAPSLSITGAGGTLSADALVGSWDGTFVFHQDAELEQFDETVVAVCKSMRIHIEFKPDGKMSMRATMLFPGSGEQTSDSTGKWEFVSAKGQSMTIRSTEDGGEAEDATLHFKGASEFEMKAPENLRSLGVMQFKRS